MLAQTAAYEVKKGDTITLLGKSLTVAVKRETSDNSRPWFIALNDEEGKRFKELFVSDFFQFDVEVPLVETNTPEANHAAEYALGVTCEDDVLDFDSVGFNSNDGVFAVAEDMKVAA